MTFYDDLAWRGLISQTTHPELPDLLEKQRFVVYAGFDPTADSLHIGSLIPLLGLVRLQRAGHTPIALMGGATAMIGDPSGKSEERSLLDTHTIERNVIGCEAQMRKFLDFGGDNAAIVANNSSWMDNVRLVTFLRDIGKHFSVNQMMARDSVRTRLEDREQGISYTEFSYQLVQAYDYLHLHDQYHCNLQVGGSDQWGNIVSGIDLIRRLRDGAETYGLTFPLVTKSDGSKFGKTEAGNVWLDPDKTSPYTFYQFWMNQADADVVKYLKFFTFLSREEIEALETQVAEAPHERAAQKALAEEMTRLVHGETELADAQRASQAMFGGDLSGLSDAMLEDIFSEMPSADLARSVLNEDKLLTDTLVEAGVFKSKGEARRLIKSGGLYLNNERVDAEDTKLSEQALASEKIAVIRTGKKNYFLLRFN